MLHTALLCGICLAIKQVIQHTLQDFDRLVAVHTPTLVTLVWFTAKGPGRVVMLMPALWQASGRLCSCAALAWGLHQPYLHLLWSMNLQPVAGAVAAATTWLTVPYAEITAGYAACCWRLGQTADMGATSVVRRQASAGVHSCATLAALWRQSRVSWHDTAGWRVQHACARRQESAWVAAACRLTRLAAYPPFQNTTRG